MIDQRPKIVVLSGLPGSGKTTIRKSIEYKNFSHVSSDDYIEYYAKSRGLSYSQVFEELIKYANTYANMVYDNAVMQSRDIIVDRTNLTKKSRSRWVSQLGNKYHKTLIIVNAKDSHIESVNSERLKVGRGIPESALSDMRGKFISSGIDHPLYDKVRILQFGK